MVVTKIQIVEAHEKPWNPFGENVLDCQDFKIGIIEKGTVGGQTTLCFAMKDTLTGMTHIAEMTGNNFQALVSAFNGADARFKNKG